MFGSLLRRIVIWPIPPRYSGQAVAIAALTAAITALTQTHAFSGVVTATAIAVVLVLGSQAVCQSRRRTR